MSARNYRDILGGLALMLVGAFAAIHAATYLNVGTIARMGPGLFPAALGVILAGFGVVIAISALFRDANMESVDLRSFLAISGSVVAFAATVQSFGFAPAIIVTALVASRADSKLSLVATLILGVVLAVVATLIFQVGLRVQVPIVAWPW